MNQKTIYTLVFNLLKYNVLFKFLMRHYAKTNFFGVYDFGAVIYWL